MMLFLMIWDLSILIALLSTYWLGIRSIKFSLSLLLFIYSFSSDLLFIQHIYSFSSDLFQKLW